jgi:hypothetical protein
MTNPIKPSPVKAKRYLLASEDLGTASKGWFMSLPHLERMDYEGWRRKKEVRRGKGARKPVIFS